MLLLMDKAGCPVASRARAWDRLLMRLRGFRLDQELARSMSRLLSTAQGPPDGGRLPVPVCRDQVRECEDELGELIGRLRARGPVPARGVAKAGLLLADASGPLYRCSARDDLRAMVREAADALIPA